MTKHAIRPKSAEEDLSEDLNFLIGSIRSRENALFFYLECIIMNRMKVRHFQEKTNKEEFLQKQKLFTTQIFKILNKYSEELQPQYVNILRMFWVRLKSIIKSSYEKLQELKVVNDTINALYKESLLLINFYCDHQNELNEYSYIEKLLKKRTLEALIASKSMISFSEPMNKNKSEHLLKIDNKLECSPSRLMEKKLEPIFEDRKNKSLSKNNEKKSENSKKNKIYEKVAKKFESNLEKMGKAYAKIINGNYECHYDKKKGLFDNATSFYEELLMRNAANQKAIVKHYLKTSRFVFNFQKFNKSSKKQREKLGKHIKLEKSNTLEENKMFIKKNNLLRAKTTFKKAHRVSSHPEK